MIQGGFAIYVHEIWLKQTPGDGDAEVDGKNKTCFFWVCVWNCILFFVVFFSKKEVRTVQMNLHNSKNLYDFLLEGQASIAGNWAVEGSGRKESKQLFTKNNQNLSWDCWVFPKFWNFSG